MIITKAMPTPQAATTGVSHPIAAGQGIRSGLCRGPGTPTSLISRLNSLACTYPCERFAPVLTNVDASLGVTVGR